MEDLADALEGAEVARLTRVHGVGKKTAERLVLELKDKVRLLPREKRSTRTVPEGPRSDLISALANLGYRPAQAEAAAETALQKLGAAGLEPLLREALRSLRSS